MHDGTSCIKGSVDKHGLDIKQACFFKTVQKLKWNVQKEEEKVTHVWFFSLVRFRPSGYAIVRLKTFRASDHH